MAIVMDAADAVYGSLASCYVTIEGNRYQFLQMTEFEAKYKTNLVDVPLLGQVNKGHKAAGGSGEWSGKAHYNQSVLRKVMKKYQDTGVMPYTEIQVTNEDPTSHVGRQTVILVNCLIDTIVVTKFMAGEEILDEELSGTFERFEMPEEFSNLSGME